MPITIITSEHTLKQGRLKMLYIYDLEMNLKASGPKAIIEAGMLTDYYFSREWIVSNFKIDVVEV